MDNELHNEQKVDLVELLDRFLRIGKQFAIWLLILMVGCSCALSGWRYATYQPVYEVYVSFTVQVANPLYASVTGYNTKTAEVMAATFPSIMSSNILRAKVMEELGISYLPYISVKAMEGVGVITVTVQDEDPVFAQKTLDALMEHYPDVAQFVLGPTKLELLDESGIPSEPGNPLNLAGTFVKGAAFGIAVWTVFVCCLAYLRNTIRDEDELKKMLNMECLGVIRNVKHSRNRVCPLISQRQDDTGFTEAIRLIEIRTEKIMKAEQKKVLLVSSAVSGEGKTTVSVNLAASLAQRGNKVILIDFDLRNPSIGKALRINVQKGIGDFLAGRCTVRDVIQKTVINNLYVIPGRIVQTGNEPPSISWERAKRLIQASENLFDYVVLDTPPCSLLADAGEIAELADSGLLVVREDLATKEQIMDGVQHLVDANLPIIGCVLNGQRKHVGEHYGYGYGYSYGYGYGTKR